jgi:hypothetical protein
MAAWVAGSHDRRHEAPGAQRGTGVIALLELTTATTLGVVAATGVAVALMVLLLRPVDRPDGSDDSDSGGGGGNVRRDPPGLGSSGGGPAWWPEFEREFADYVARVNASSRGH